jgi:hypothetical protein
MPSVTTNKAVTRGLACRGDRTGTGKVYRPALRGQIVWRRLLLVGLAIHLFLTGGNPVLYGANGWRVRQETENQRPANNKSNKSPGGQDSWRQSLQSKLSVQWQQVELKQIVGQSDWPGVTLWCDRRVDSSRVVDLAIQTQPLHQVVQALAEHCQLGLAIHQGVVVLVPNKMLAEALPVVLADARRQAQELPPALGRPWLERQARRWPTLSQPNLLLADWPEPLPKSWTVAPLPHDVWDAGHLPALPLIEQIALVAFGFGLRPVFTLSGPEAALTFEPLTTTSICTMPVEDTLHRTELRKLKPVFAERYPDLSARFDNDPQVSGPLLELGVLLATLESKRPQPGAPTGEVRYTIKLEGQPAESVLRFLAQQVKRELSFEPELPPALLAKPIQLDANQWTLEELCRQIGLQAELEIQLDASRIQVRRSRDPQ